MPEQRRSRVERAEAYEEEKSNQHQAERKSEVTLHRVRVETPDSPGLVRREPDEFAGQEQLVELVAQVAWQPREVE